MSRVAPKTGERVEATKRRPMTPARKKRTHAFHKGLCEVCGEPVDLDGPHVVYDHRIPVWDGGADDDGPNLRPLHRHPCDAEKTSKDQENIGRTKRRIAKDTGTRRPRKAINSPGFRKGVKTVWAKRKFEKRKP